MILKLLDASSRTCVIQHGHAESPLVDSRRRGILIFLIQRGNDERLGDEPATKVHTPDLVRGVIPRLGERLGERLCPCAVIERILWIVDPWIKVEEVRKV